MLDLKQWHHVLFDLVRSSNAEIWRWLQTCVERAACVLCVEGGTAGRHGMSSLTVVHGCSSTVSAGHVTSHPRDYRVE